MGSRSFSVGNYTRNTDSQEDPFNTRVRAFRDDSVDTLPDTFENWPKERVKEAVEGMLRADQRQQDLIATKDNADVFLAAHPEFLDTTANGQLMNHELKRMFGDCLHTFDQYEAAYESLRASNFLALNKAEVEKQRKAAAKARVEVERARSVEPSLDELWAMPLEDLRRLDAVENQQRMQRRGEEGGWY
jgi:hypothetical protein